MLAFLFWRATRYEDVVISRWLTDGSEVLDDGGWLENLGVPTPHSTPASGLTGPSAVRGCGPRGATRLVAAVSHPTVEVAPTVDPAPLSTGDGSPGQPLTASQPASWRPRWRFQWTPHLPRALARKPTADLRLSCRWSWIGSGRSQPLACGPVPGMC